MEEGADKKREKGSNGTESANRRTNKWKNDEINWKRGRREVTRAI